MVWKSTNLLGRAKRLLANNAVPSYHVFGREWVKESLYHGWREINNSYRTVFWVEYTDSGIYGGKGDSFGQQTSRLLFLHLHLLDIHIV